MKLDAKTLAARVLLIVACLIVFIYCFMKMTESYDPLARYPYTTEENRAIILEYLDDDDIDYIITNQIQPEEFLPYIQIEGFNIRNTRFYTIAKNTQDAENEYIVNFVNKYRSYFTRDTFEDLLKNYSYQDLTAFYENDVLIHEDLTLVANPSAPYVLLNPNTSVYKYSPADLKGEGIQYRSSMEANLAAMQSAYSSMLSRELVFARGYTSYESLIQMYAGYDEVYGDRALKICFPAGSNELQLGYTLVTDKADMWIEQCLNHGSDISEDYSPVIEGLDDDIKEEIEWLEDNAYQYGFVIRYPKEKEDLTNHIYQPFELRYVGKDTAKQMYNASQCMEEASFGKKLK